jgi:PPP family 3-phenylpropionic acid transporter
LESSDSSRSAFQIRATIFVFYAGLAFIALHTTRWFKIDLGLSESTIALMACSGYVCCFLTQPLWGLASDRARRRRIVLRICLVSGGVQYMLLGVFGARMPLPLLWCVAVGGLICMSPSIYLLNSIAMRHVGVKRQTDFAFFRVQGSISFMIATVIGLGLLSWLGLPRSGLVALGGAVFISAVWFTRWEPQTIGPRKRPSLRDASQLLRQKNLLWVYIASAALHVSFGGVMTFVGPYFAQLGGSEEHYAIAWGVGVAGEIPLMLLLPRLIRRFGMKRILCASMTIDACRFGVMALAPNATWAMGIWCFHGLAVMGGFILLPMFINALAPEDLRATAQTIQGALYSLGMIAGVLFARFLIAHFGSENLLAGYRCVFGRTAIGVALAVVVLSIVVRENPGKETSGG